MPFLWQHRAPLSSQGCRREFRQSDVFRQLAGTHREIPSFAFRYLFGKAPADSADFPLQISDSRFRVYSLMVLLIADRAILILSASSPCSLICFERGISWRSPPSLLRCSPGVRDLHAVQQRTGNRVQLIGCGDEHDFGQIKLHFQVVVGEREVLLRIKNLQQCEAGSPRNRCRSYPPRRA